MDKDLQQLNKALEMIDSVVLNLSDWLGSIRKKADSVKVKIIEAIDLESKDLERIKVEVEFESQKLSQVKEDVVEMDKQKVSLKNDIDLLVKHKEETIKEYQMKEERYEKSTALLAEKAKQARLDYQSIERDLNSIKKERKNVKNSNKTA